MVVACSKIARRSTMFSTVLVRVAEALPSPQPSMVSVRVQESD